MSELWDTRYDSEEYAFGTAPNDFLVSVSDRIPRGKVLCIGDGEGRNGVYLAELGCDVTSVDLSPVGSAKARRLAEARSVPLRTIVADLALFDVGTSCWDAVVSIFCHLPSVVRAVVHPAIVAGLRPGGILVLEAYTPAQIGRGTGGPPVAEPTLTAAIVRSDFAGLSFDVLAELERPVIEGRFHTGDASVVQVLARRPTG